VESSEPEAKKKIEEIRLKRRELFNERLSAAPLPAGGRVAAPSDNGGAKNKKDPMALVREIKGLAAEAMEATSVEGLRGALKKILSLIDELEDKVVVAAAPEAPKADPEFEAKMEAMGRMLDELDAMERKFTADMDGFNQVFRKAIKAVEAKKDELDALEDESARVSFEKEKIKYRETELEHQLSAMGRSFAEFVGVPETGKFDPVAAERRIYRLRGELASIGEVDESIIRESQEAEERFESVSSQIEELKKASSDLKALIKELDFKIRHEFSGALGKINKELSDFAKLMFGGGKISLKLEEIMPPAAEASGPIEERAGVLPSEDEEPKQGIEIEVALPKKRVKGLEVLSGGERSLLSTAILFGLISISPPPFIVLDEVDAALDERNARRFGEMLDRFEGRSQFIVVTHNRATMESADALYGVTMGEDGSSKLVSLKLS